MRALALDRAALEDVRAALRGAVADGLAKDGAQVRALPAYLPPAPAGLRGRALAIDCGGTNLRAAVVELGEADRLLAGPVTAKVPTGRDGASVSRSVFFDAHAELAARLAGAEGLPVGYCFSYPSQSRPDHDATLIRWTKGVRVEGVEGTAVGAGLRAALAARGLAPGAVAVLNDTVASLIAGSRGTPSPERMIGLIVGTGTNMATFIDAGEIAKPHASWRGSMAINLESGNFHPPHLTAWDDALDARSENPSAQRFEKAVSGHYLPRLFQVIAPDGAPESGEDLVRFAAEQSERGTLARLLLDRSADLVAAALAAVADHHPGEEPIGVLAEGGLFWSASGYRGRVAETLRMLGRPLEIRRQADANLAGAAVAALSAPK
ncbi:MAG: hypothetical protein IT384_34130 [Deltaproteobacteria bacterium]|nr:hypothetical protein [Deltaproteobacteria bacterium]